MKWFKATILLAILFLPSLCFGETLTRKDTVSCSYPTNINGHVADWDTVFVIIKTASGHYVTTVPTSHSQPGRWEGYYPCNTLLGGYNRWYYAVYGSDTAVEVYPFSVIDSGAFFGTGGCSPPTGTQTIVVRVKKESDSTAIGNCLVQVWNIAGNVMQWSDYTNSSGAISFMFDPDTLLVKLFRPQYTFTVPETLRINGDEDTTYYGSAVVEPPPVTPMCRVSGLIGELTGVNDNGYLITFEIETKPLRYLTKIISPYSCSIHPDGLGFWSIDLYPNILLTPDNTVYKLSIKDLKNNKDVVFGNYKPYIYITVPNQSYWQMTW
jgi:hypothetical protein